MEDKKVHVQFITSPGCLHCAEVRKIFEELKPNYPGLEIEEVDVTTPKGMEIALKYSIMASPGIIVNGELFSTGGLNKDKFKQMLNSLP